MMYFRTQSGHPKGFALLIALILTSVILALGISLLDIAYKQVVLSSSAKNSQYAFYNADSALECALYYDQQQGAFFYDDTFTGTVKCSTLDVTDYASTVNGSTRVTVYSVPCFGGGVSADVTVIKTPANATSIYANGYSSCTDNPTRIERGLKVKY